MAKTRVLYCIEAMVHGGTEKQLAALITGLDRARVEPLLCTLKPSTMDLAALDCEVIELGFRTFRSCKAVHQVWRLRQSIKDHRVDVLQTFFQDPTLVGLLGSLGTDVRSRIATFRDMGFWRTRAKVAQLRLAYPHFDGFIANSKAVARHVHEQDGIPLDKIAIIPNGVQMGPESRSQSRSGRPVVGIVANLDRPVKRVDLFLESATLVRRVVPAVEFVVIGDGHLRQGLQEKATRLGIADCVRFLGSITNAAEEIRRFDIGVMCSDSEGLSNAILEYMAAGVPTVARHVGGNDEAVIDGETGRLVPSSHPEDIAHVISALLVDEHERLRLGARARDVAERTFSMEACVRRHEEVYDRLLTAGNEATRRHAVVENATR